MTTTINAISGAQGGYHDRTEDHAGKHYDKHLFIAGRILQSAEMNEIQSSQQAQLKSVADALFKDGDIVRDCSAVINNGQATLESGAIYLQGQVRGIAKDVLTIQTTGTVIIGAWLVQDVITKDDDASLLDPAAGTQGFNEQGAYRLRLVPKWGTSLDTVADATFYPVYYVDDGQLRAKEPPPNLDAVSQALARYDVDSNGSNYIISGLRVTRLADEGNDQVYSVDSGRARVNGFGIAQNSARRVKFPINIPLRSMTTESVGLQTVNGKQRIDVTYHPLHSVSNLRIQRKATPSLARGRGNSDTFLSTNEVAVVLKVYDNNTVYTQGTDYTHSGQVITWVTGGKAPVIGQDYNVDVYQWETTTPVNQDDHGFEVTNGIEATATNPVNPITARFDYTFRLPRIDRLVVAEDGKFTWIEGIASEINPASPPVPNNVLSVAQVYQAWADDLTKTYVMNDGVRMVSMSTLEAMNARLDNITDMVAQVNLISDINIRDAGVKKGLFVDPFTNNSQRDTALPQELAITGNCLQLPIAATPLTPVPAAGQGLTQIESCVYTEEVILGNTAYTTSMKVNPYMAFDPPFPGSAVLSPSIDRWVNTNTTWAAPETRYFVTTVYAPWSIQYGMHMTQNYTTGQNTVNELASSTTADAETLRDIEVHFTVTGFKANEEVVATFDGLPVTLTP
ncbi:DUF4815 domain-containing protein [Salmonella enterica]|nr:DUF4815 domain-containing protein [Salmonella enterica subsp. enterica serovar Saintpaul]EEC1303941.1 DUF4815 domain-containing protein [Salmonella enterica]